MGIVKQAVFFNHFQARKGVLLKEVYVYVLLVVSDVILNARKLLNEPSPK